MSDRNFNRILLPSKSNKSGYRAGEVRTKQKVKNILLQVLKEFEGERLTPMLENEILSKLKGKLDK